MDELLQQQMEALETAKPFCERIVVALKNVIEELEGSKLQDTDEYLKDILNGLNWVFQIYNGTKDLINKDSMVIDENKVNEYVVKLNEANSSNEDMAKAQALVGIKSFVEDFQAVAEKLTA